MDKKFNELLKEARINSNLKQTDVERLSGISAKLLSSYENGKTEPDIDTLRKLAITYNVSADYFLNLNTDKKNNNVYMAALIDLLSQMDNDELFDLLQIIKLFKGKKG